MGWERHTMQQSGSAGCFATAPAAHALGVPSKQCGCSRQAGCCDPACNMLTLNEPVGHLMTFEPAACRSADVMGASSPLPVL